jgi:3-hydroxybutyrate dehydrogenase
LENEWGGVDVLINNAGIQHVASLEDFPVDRWKLLTEILLVGPALLSRAVLPSMRARNFGRIVNVGSIHSLVASPHKSAYVAAKHGLLGFSKTVALETADCDITINTLCPSYVKTALVQKQISSQALAHGISEDEVINKIMLEPMPKKSFIDMDELCGAMNFLLSDAARNMTGQEMVIDGGWTIR